MTRPKFDSTNNPDPMSLDNYEPDSGKDPEVIIIDDPTDNDDDDDSDLDDHRTTSDDNTTSFDGFGDANDATADVQTKILQALDVITQRLERLEHGKSGNDSISPEEFNELAKRDPGAALEYAIDSVLKKRGYGGVNPAEIAGAAANQVHAAQTVQESRKLINERYDPKNNPELAKAARQIYLDRVSRGITVDKVPTLELDSFILAAEQNPHLRPAIQQRGKSSKSANNQPGRGSSNSQPVMITRALREIGENWGIDMTDPKIAKRIVKSRDNYDRRRIDKPYRRSRNG